MIFDINNNHLLAGGVGAFCVFGAGQCCIVLAQIQVLNDIELTMKSINILLCVLFEVRASHGPGPSVTESVGRSLGHSVTHTLADLCSI